MKFLVMTDIEGVTGVTTFPQAENSEFGRRMLMNDLHAVLDGIREAGGEAVVYDMHTDGRNINIEEIDVPVVMGKPILPTFWRGVGPEGFDGLYMIGLHAMQNAGVYGIPLKMVSGDDAGCREAQALIPSVITCAVKDSLRVDCARCLPPCVTKERLSEAAKKAALAKVEPFTVPGPYEIRIRFSDCAYHKKMRELHPEIFEDTFTAVMKGCDLLAAWSEYLVYEKEMVEACK